MTIEVRAAQMGEYPVLREIFARAFETEDEARLWDYLVAHEPSLRPEGVRVAVVDGRPVACTVVLPRRVRIRQDWAPGAVITLVACHPDYQNQGYGGRTVRDALAYMADQGLAIGVLYGHPGYYPRFGFVPVLPDQSTILASSFPLDATLAGCWEKIGEEAPEEETPGEEVLEWEKLRPVAEEDLPALAALYAAQMSIYPCAMAREAEPWLWSLRNTRHNALLTLPERQGYALVSSDRAHNMLVIQEGAAVDVVSGRRLLAGLVGEAQNRGLAKLRLVLPPGHLLVRLALLWGAEQSCHPATAGMAAITCWKALLPPGYQVNDQGLAYRGQLVLRADAQALIELVVGYRGIDDLLLEPDVALPGGDADYELLRRDFPPGFPKWSPAPFWLGEAGL
ncbi:MAG: GNAT family N-acetyltransferase [Syntrophothermus sp.]